MTGRSPSVQHPPTSVYGHPHLPYTFVPGYLRFQPAVGSAPSYDSFTVHSANPKSHSLVQAVQHGQGSPRRETSWEPFYTFPKRTPVRISKPGEPCSSQAMEIPTASLHPTSDIGIASADKSCHIATTAAVGILQEPKLPTRSSYLNPLAPAFDASAPPSPPSIGTPNSVSDVPITNTMHPQPRIFGRMQVLPGPNPVLSSSVFFSSPELIPTVMSAASIPPASDLPPKAKAESVGDDSRWITHDLREPQSGARGETTTLRQPDALLQDQDQVACLEKTSQSCCEPVLLHTPIGDGFWAALALYVERDIDVAQSRFNDLEGRFISDYRDHAPQELGELVAEAVKDEKEKMMQQR